MKLNEILSGINCKISGCADNVSVENIIYDSRKAAPGLMFVCIKGFKSDGHTYAKDVYEKGVRVFAANHELSLIHI